MAGPEPAWPREGKNQQCWARISLAQQHNWRGEGELFSLPSSCMQNAIHSACRREKTQQNANNEGEEELPGAEEAVRRWSGCFAGGGGRWWCRGSRTAAPNSNLAVSSGGERDSSSSPLLYFFFVLSFSVSFTSGCLFVLSVLFFKKFPFPISSFPLIFPFSLYYITLFSVTFLFVLLVCF